jgi:hypothetical protein
MGVHPGKLGKKKIQKKHRLQKLNWTISVDKMILYTENLKESTKK